MYKHYFCGSWFHCSSIKTWCFSNLKTMAVEIIIPKILTIQHDLSTTFWTIFIIIQLDRMYNNYQDLSYMFWTWQKLPDDKQTLSDCPSGFYYEIDALWGASISWFMYQLCIWLVTYHTYFSWDALMSNSTSIKLSHAGTNNFLVVNFSKNK
jgi:hypothetical protein